jgi:hypothetical protein
MPLKTTDFSAKTAILEMRGNGEREGEVKRKGTGNREQGTGGSEPIRNKARQ